MIQKIEPATVLNYESSHADSAQASVGRAFTDWQMISQTMGRERFPGAREVSLEPVNEIALVEDDGTLTLSSGELNYPAVWEEVRKAFGDKYDFLTFFTDFAVPFGYSFWSAIHFNTPGISPFLLPYDRRESWKTERLQGFHFINPFHLGNMGVHLREFGHQWLSYVYFADSPDSEYVYADLLLGTRPGHWDDFMDDGHSPMNYDFVFTPYMATHWEQRISDTPLFAYHQVEGIAYCDLDLYLMGLVPAEDVPPFYFIAEPKRLGRRTWTGRRADVTVDMVIHAMGPRPAPIESAPDEYRNAWILVTENRWTARKMAYRLDEIRQEFELRFQAATRCLASVDTTLG